jgi:hypothetical protein
MNKIKSFASLSSQHILLPAEDSSERGAHVESIHAVFIFKSCQKSWASDDVGAF